MLVGKDHQTWPENGEESMTIAAIYTAQALVEPLSAVFARELPDARLVNLVDGALIADIIREGSVTPPAARRVLHLAESGVDAGADVLLSTCSSLGDIIDGLGLFTPIPVLRIDLPMVQEAVSRATRIAVLATLPTTLGPTVRLVEREAVRAGKDITVTEGLASGAFDALVSGKAEEHDRILMTTARAVAQEADLLLLAQGSMARMERGLADETGLPVLSSLESGVRQLRAHGDLG